MGKAQEMREDLSNPTERKIEEKNRKEKKKKECIDVIVKIDGDALGGNKCSTF